MRTPAIQVLLLSVVALLPMGQIPAAELSLREDAASHTFSVFREDNPKPVLTQNARPDFRPYLHPILSHDGKTVLTEFSPGHHKHQTGVYWGFTRLNGRDYFTNPGGAFWRKVSARITAASGEEVKWTTTYQLHGEDGPPVMQETQQWNMRDTGKHFLLDLEWKGEALADITVANHPYGGLFLRMPWRPGMQSSVVNSAGQRDRQTDTQRASWLDLGLKLEGRDNQAHIAILDHPSNDGHPLPWRVDKQLGIGPSRAILGDSTLAKGQTATYRHQFVIYEGNFDDLRIAEAFKSFTGTTSAPKPQPPHP